uniref:Uncharacterized protein n=1 Tax=Nelumbo nucifera TaxID=4432 RepID=A0A822XR46_NELNU|nr:TPA_asm: hypothetical protein HUJ06_022698 [Nelumbo nucifera]
MKEGEKVDKYFAWTLTTVNKMKVHGEKMEHIIIIKKILRSMTSRFDYVEEEVEAEVVGVHLEVVEEVEADSDLTKLLWSATSATT